MAFKFPFSTLHELNLDWILEQVKKFSELIPPMETAVDDVQALQTDVEQAVEDANAALEDATQALETAEEAKEIAEQAAQGTIADGAVTTVKLDDGAVTTAKIADGAVTGNKIGTATIQTGNLSQGCVTSVQILDGTIVNGDIADHTITAIKLASDVFNAFYPVGSIYLSTQSTSPATLFGGTWARIQDTFLLASGETYLAGSTGGEATHTLTVAELPAHSHSITNAPYTTATGSRTNGTGIPPHNGTASGNDWEGVASNTGSGNAHNNMPPYLAVYMWQRTA